MFFFMRYVIVRILVSSLAVLPLLGGAEALEKVTPAEMVARALENNFDIQIQRLDVDISRDRVSGAWGQFEPQFSFNIGYDRSQRAQNARERAQTSDDLGALFGQPGSVTTEVVDEEAYRATTGLSGLLPTGTRYEVTTGMVRRRNNFTRGQRFDPEFQSTSQLTVIQPLLRNAGTEVGLAQVRLLRSESLGARHETRLGIDQVIGQVLATLFELEFAVENIAVKEESLVLANALLRDNQRRVEEGRMSPIDVTQAQVRVSEAREELIEAKSFHAQRQNLLQELTGREYDFNAPYVEVRDIDKVLPEVELSRDSLTGDMFNYSPIYLSALETVEGENIRLVFAENQRHPQIDLQMTLGYNGLRDSASLAFYDYSRRSRPDYGVGLEVSFPIGGKTAEAQISEARRRRSQAVMRVKQTEIQLMSALDNAVREVETGIQRRELIEDAVRLAQEALMTEQRRLDAGRTTSYDVLTQQRELSFVRTRALAADASVRRAKTQLLLIQGVLAEALGFDITLNGNRTL